MTKEEIKALTEEQVEARAAELAEAAKADGADLEAIEAETLALEERRAQLIGQRKADAAAVAAGAGEVIEKREEKKKMKTIEEIRASREYEEAYVKYLKTGNDMECRTLTTDLILGDSIDAVPTPSYLAERIETSWNESSLWSAITRKYNVKGVMRVPLEISADDAVVHNEADTAPAEERITIREKTVFPKIVKKWVKITDELLGLNGRAFLDYIYDEIEHKIIEKAESLVVNAIIASSQYDSSTRTPGISTEVPFASLAPASVYGALAALADGARNPVCIMSKKLFFDYMALTDLQGRPIYNIVPENGRPAYYLNGVRVIFADIPDQDTGDLTIRKFIVGDLDGLIVNLPNGDGTEFVYDPYTLATEDMVRIVGKMYMGCEVTRKSYFAVGVVQIVNS